MAFLEILFFLFPVFPLIHARAACPVSRCGSNGSTIGFPFLLAGQQPQNCGYPGFNLSCRGPGITALNFPYWGEFFVRGIDYITQEIQLYDPDNCLPKRLLAFNLTDSPFAAEYYQNYTFLSCPTETTRSRFTAIDCLSNSTTSILATSSMTLASKMRSCRILTTRAVPVSWPVQNEEGFSSDLSSDLQLTWDVPNCGDCRLQGGSCGFWSNSSLEVGCFPPGTENGSRSSGSLYVFKIILLSITLPAIICSVGIALYMCFTGRRLDRRRVNAQMAAALEAPPPEPAVVMGLDESTIESYTKVVLGESRRVPGLSDNTCPICLSEYCTKETLRCIPDCKHCFHAECIDEWLRVNGTCPVCRNSLSPVHANSFPDPD